MTCAGSVESYNDRQILATGDARADIITETREHHEKNVTTRTNNRQNPAVSAGGSRFEYANDYLPIWVRQSGCTTGKTDSGNSCSSLDSILCYWLRDEAECHVLTQQFLVNF